MQHDVPLGPSHVIELLRIEDRGRRHQLQEKAARERLSVRKLRREVTAALA